LALAVLAVTIVSLIVCSRLLAAAQGEKPLVAVVPRQQPDQALRVAYQYRNAEEQATAYTAGDNLDLLPPLRTWRKRTPT
jgi:anti-sigma-K factor RskA